MSDYLQTPGRVAAAILLLVWSISGKGQAPDTDLSFPVEPQLFADEPFTACEGIAFNGEGDLYATCNRSLWNIALDGTATLITELHSNLGLAGIGESDLLVADFGPENAFRNGRNSDGIVWRISPDGTKTELVLGIGDPNFILVQEDGSFLVFDDATSDIYIAQQDGSQELFTTAVNHPNGLALSLDGSSLYVAQIFTNIRPVVMDNALWEIKLREGRPQKDARLMVRADPDAAVDGIALDAQGRIYIAANRAGRVWRYDPGTDEMLLIAEGMPGVASLAFGEGAFDHESIYATTTYSGGKGGDIWRIPVGVKGAALYR